MDRDALHVGDPADYSNFLVANGRTYGHILDPRSLQPSNAALSVTVLSDDGTIADAMSKAAFILGPRDGVALIDSYPGMAGMIAYRQADGGVGMALSQRMKGRFHPVPSPSVATPHGR